MKIFLWMFLWLVLVPFHLMMIAANLLAIVILPLYTPWYICVPLIASIIENMIARRLCVLTKLENEVRPLLGYRRIASFVGHYFIKPYKMIRYGYYNPNLPEIDC